jgi:hypothetical protein
MSSEKLAGAPLLLKVALISEPDSSNTVTDGHKPWTETAEARRQATPARRDATAAFVPSAVMPARDALLTRRGSVTL